MIDSTINSTYSFKELGRQVNLIKKSNNFNDTEAVGGSQLTVEEKDLRSTNNRKAYAIKATGGSSKVKAVRVFETTDNSIDNTVSIFVQNSSLVSMKVIFKGLLRNNQTPEATVAAQSVSKIVIPEVRMTEGNLEIQFATKEITGELNILVADASLKNGNNLQQNFNPHVEDYTGESAYRHIQGVDVRDRLEFLDDDNRLIMEIKNLNHDPLTIDLDEFGSVELQPYQYRLIELDKDTTTGKADILFSGKVNVVVHNIRVERIIKYKTLTDFYSNPTYSFKEVAQGKVPEDFVGESEYRYIELFVSPYPETSLFPGHSAESQSPKLYPMGKEEID